MDTLPTEAVDKTKKGEKWTWKNNADDRLKQERRSRGTVDSTVPWKHAATTNFEFKAKPSVSIISNGVSAKEKNKILLCVSYSDSIREAPLLGVHV